MKYLLLLLLLVYNVVWATGLKYNTYACPAWPCTQSGLNPISTGTINTTINYNWGGGVVLNSGRSDYVSVNATGYITIPGTAGQTVTVNFLTSNDDASQLSVNGISVINDWSGLHGESGRQGSINLTAGQTYPISIWFAEWGGGAVWRVYWSVANGPGNGSSWVLLDPAYTSVTYTPPAPVYSSSITPAQQSRVDSWTNRTISGNSLYVDQIGSNNSLTVTQKGPNNVIGAPGQAAIIHGDSNIITIRQGDASNVGKNQADVNVVGNANILNINQAQDLYGISTLSTNNHYQQVSITGNSNSVSTQQTNTGGIGGHYMETIIVGSTNTVINKQLDNGNKTMFTNINGSGNSLTATQQGTGQHYLDVKMTGPSNLVSVLQDGTNPHRATIDVTNAGGPNNINLQQTGNNSQTYSITQTCLAPAGCSVLIRQP